MTDTTRDYHNHTISLTQNWKFTITGPEFEDDAAKGREIFFNSFVDARFEIDKRINESEKIRAQNIKLEEDVLDVNGDRKTITRIDRRSGDIVGVEGKVVYPAVPWTVDALKRRKQLLNEVFAIETGLREVQIYTSRAIGRIDAEDYPSKVARLGDEIREKSAKARELQQLKLKGVETALPQNQTA